MTFGLRRLTGFAILTAMVAAAVADLQVAVPLTGPSLEHAEATRHWHVAVVAGLVVLVGVAAVAWLSLGQLKRTR